MYFALVYYPNIDNEAFHSFRRKYDPWYFLLPPHVPFVFPTPVEIGRKNLENHISYVLNKWEKFEVRFNTIEKTWDHWMFLGAGEGKEKVVRLHDELYTDILASHLRTDLPFDPHIGLGVFSKQEYNFNHPEARLELDLTRFQKALDEFKQLKFEIACTIDRLVLIEINEDFTRCDDLRTFLLA